MLLNVLAVIFVIIALIAAGVYLLICKMGKENIVAYVEQRTPLAVDNKTEDSVTISTNIGLANIGKSCGVIMDAIVRPNLPYEQYDGIEVHGHAENVKAPREDDYFEATIIDNCNNTKGGDKLTIKCQLKLSPRKGMTLKEAVAGLPDFNFQLIWLEVGRTPAHYRQVRIEVPAADVVKLVG